MTPSQGIFFGIITGVVIITLVAVIKLLQIAIHAPACVM